MSGSESLFTADRINMGGYLLVRTGGIIDSFEVMSDRVSKSVDNILKNDHKRLLIDDRNLLLELDAYDMSRIGVEHEERCFSRLGVRIACLYPPEKRDSYVMLETVHRNRAINFRLFESEEEALSWLLG